MVLAGGGHVDFADAVPGRVAGVTAIDMAMVTQTRDDIDGAGPSVFALRSRALELPPAGRLGVAVDDARGELRVSGFTPVSAGRDAGLEVNDRLLGVDDRVIGDLGDLRLALWRRQPGDLVDLAIRRDGQRRSLRFALR